MLKNNSLLSNDWDMSLDGIEIIFFRDLKEKEMRFSGGQNRKRCTLTYVHGFATYH